MKHVILNNVNLCVENLSKLLNETCPDAHQDRTSASGLISMRNNNHQRFSEEHPEFIQVSVERTKDAVVVTEGERCHVYAASRYRLAPLILLSMFIFKHSDPLRPNPRRSSDHLPDGIILHRGQRFGRALGEAMVRRSDTNGCVLAPTSSHPISTLNRLLTKTNCLLMQQHKIETIEDLIRLYLREGQDQFTDLMVQLFQVDPFITDQLNGALLNWVRKCTSNHS